MCINRGIKERRQECLEGHWEISNIGRREVAGRIPVVGSRSLHSRELSLIYGSLLCPKPIYKLPVLENVKDGELELKQRSEDENVSSSLLPRDL